MTKISVSNIAWPAEVDSDALVLAKQAGFCGIEIAPVKVFGSWGAVEESAIESYRRKLADLDLEVPALQGIMFQTNGCQLFDSEETRLSLFNHLVKIAHIAECFGAKACVYGAPSTRNPGRLTKEQAWDIAVGFFRKVAFEFEKRGVALCFEANPSEYDCRFVTHTGEAHALVKAVDQPGFRLQLDTGTMIVNSEDPECLRIMGEVIGHFHVSEGWLKPVGLSRADHKKIGEVKSSLSYPGWCSVEMLSTNNWRHNLFAAADLVIQEYGAS